MSRFSRTELLGPVLLVLLVLALYGRALGYGFVVDDHALIERNAALASWATLPEALTHDLFHFSEVRASPYWRPLVTLSYYLDHALGDGAAWAFHLDNLIWLMVAAIGVSRLAPGWAGVAMASAFIAHPLQVEGAASIASRTDLMCMAFCAWALTAGPRAAAILTLGACLSKEIGLVLPLALVLAGKPSWKGAGVVACVVLALRMFVPLGAMEGSPELLQAPGRMLGMASRLIWPGFVGMASDAAEWPLALGLLFVALALAAGWRFQRGSAAMGLCALLAVSGVLGVHRASDALLLLPLLAVAWAAAGNVRPPILLGIAAVGAVVGSLRLPHWQSDLRLWEATHEARPLDLQPRLGIARAVVDADPGRALEVLEGAVGDTEREEREVHEVRARAALGLGNEAMAIQELRLAAQDDSEALWANAMLCVMETVVSDCEQAARLSPDDPSVWNSLGLALLGERKDRDLVRIDGEFHHRSPTGKPSWTDHLWFGATANAVEAFDSACALGLQAGCRNAEQARSELQEAPRVEGGLP